MSRVPLFAANWKMNKTIREGVEFVGRFKTALAEIPAEMGKAYEVVLAPSSTHLKDVGRELQGSGIALAGQNCGVAKFGAYTGEVSPAVLRELGADWVIVGHSERRHVFKEEDFLILTRVRAGMEDGLKVILCVGEVLQDRKAGNTFKVIERQLSILKQNQLPPTAWKQLVVAYEPVWAIGTGENATPQQAQEVHAFIRNWVIEKFSADEGNNLRILYGGSVKPENASQIMGQKDIDGLLVGGASLDPVTFAGVIKNGLKSRT